MLVVHQLAQQLLVLGANLVLVPLDEAQEGLVPHHRELARLLAEAQEVVHEGVDDAERQGVLLIEEHAEEEGRGAGVLQLGELEQRGGGVQHRDGPSREHRREHNRLTKRARPTGAQRDEYALVERRGFKRRLLQRLIQREVQPFMFGNIVADAGQEHERVKPLRHLRVEVGREKPRRLVHGVRAPLLRVGEVQHLFPVAQRRDDLERLGYFPDGVSSQEVAHLSVHLHHLLVHPLGDGGTVVAVGAHVVAAAAPALLLFDLLQDDVREGPLLARLGLHERGERGFVFG